MNKLKGWIDSSVAFLQKYPTQVHTFFLLWNAFVVSWATKAKVPLDIIGIPITINASSIVSWLQLHTHMPTAVVALATFVLNAIVAYTSWKKKHVDVIDVPAGSVLIAQPPVADTLAAVEKTDNIQVNIASNTPKAPNAKIRAGK